MTHYEQSVIDREAPAHGEVAADGFILARREGLDGAGDARARRRRLEGRRARREGVAARADRAARARALRAIVAERFPHIRAPAAAAVPSVAGGPSLLDLGELERSRDELAAGCRSCARGWPSAPSTSAARASSCGG